MRKTTYIMALAMITISSSALSAEPRCDLSGDDWICSDVCAPMGGTVKIEQSGRKLQLLNEQGGSSKGFWETEDNIRAVDWEKGLRGTVSKDCQKISWEGKGTIWIR